MRERERKKQLMHKRVKDRRMKLRNSKEKRKKEKSKIAKWKREKERKDEKDIDCRLQLNFENRYLLNHSDFYDLKSW